MWASNINFAIFIAFACNIQGLSETKISHGKMKNLQR